jgi:hypothetical protein
VGNNTTASATVYSTAIAAATQAVLSTTTTSAANVIMPAPLPAATAAMNMPTAAGLDNKTSSLVESKDGKEAVKTNRTAMLSQPHEHDLIAALKLDSNVNTKLRRLNDVLKPYLREGDVDAEFVDDVEAVKREQDRHMNLLHRNFSSLQSSLDTAQQVLNSKVLNHLTDNQTLLREVNQLRSEVSLPTKLIKW